MTEANAERVRQLSPDGSPESVFFAALDLFCRVVTARNEGKVVGSVDPATDTLTTVTTPLLENAAKAGRYVSLHRDDDAAFQRP